jgi:NADP-dependent 3-hydroxy acid dehydrogenase YdfG
MKKIIIIAGVTGSMGQEFLRKYLLVSDTLIYGISRKGAHVSDFSFLPDHHMIINVDLTNKTEIESFVEKIPKQEYESISYFHLVGEFKTELTSEGKVVVEHSDVDGIDKTVRVLVADAYKHMVSAIISSSLCTIEKINIVSFGSLADPHKLGCFQSFWKSRNLVKEFSLNIREKHQNSNFYLFNTSTLCAADEMLERPFIFATPVNPQFWITPHDLVQRVSEYIDFEKGFVEHDIYVSNPLFNKDYFTEQKTHIRRVRELYNKMI